MKGHILLWLLPAGLLLLLLLGCGAKKPGKGSVTPPEEGEPLELTSFSFWHTASFANDCYQFTVTRQESGCLLSAEELFSGGRVAEAVAVEPSVLEQLGTVAGKYRVDLWDGFDENNKHVMDGSSFTLEMTLSDGRTVTARGNNCFPDRYSEVYSELHPLYESLMERYCPDEEPQDGITTKTQDPAAPKTIASRELVSFRAEFFCRGNSENAEDGVYKFDLKKKSGVWQLESSGLVRGGGAVGEDTAAQVQALIETYDLAAKNGLYSVTSGLPVEFSPSRVSADYASGERLIFAEDGNPEAEWCAALRDCFLETLSDCKADTV